MGDPRPWKHIVSSSLERVIQFICHIFAGSDLAKIRVIMETSSSSAFIRQINEHYCEPHPELGAGVRTEKKVEVEAALLELTVWSRVILAMLC